MSDNYTEYGDWLEESSCQAILRETHVIAFGFHGEQRKLRVSSFINEYVSGNYDGRHIFDVMLEDNVIHPKDMEKTLRFRERVIAGQSGEIMLRLMTPGGKYRWFRVIVSCQKSGQDYSNYVGILEDAEVLMQYQELLRYRAEIDPVSGI